MLIIHIKCNLRTIILFTVSDELLWCAWKPKLLWYSAELLECLDELLLCRVLFELDKYSCCMTV